MRRKRARGRAPDANAAPGTWSLATRQWGLCEWFAPWLDAPFFAFNEFDDVMYSMGMEHLFLSGATRAEWNRLRAAMCNAFVGGHAAPRRLSRAFLEMEARDLAIYRADVRAVLRGQTLAPAVDPISGESLGLVWWTRYRYAPPDPPRAGSDVLIRGADGRVLRAQFLALVDADRIRILLSGGVEHDVLDVDVMVIPPTDDTDAPQTATVSAAAAAAAPAPISEPIASAAPDMRTPPSARRALFGSAVPRTPLSLSGSISRATRISLFSDFQNSASGAGSMARLVSRSPRAALLASPRVAGPLVSRINAAPTASEEVEAEVDIGRLAELIRLHDRKESAVTALQRANDEAEQEMNRGTTAVRPDTRAAAEASIAMLSEVNARIEVVAPPGFGLQEGQAETPRPHRIAQRLDAAFVASGSDGHPPPLRTPESAKRPRISRVSDVGGGTGGIPQHASLHERLPLFEGRNDEAPMRGNGAAGSVDFASAGGAIVLAKSLCKSGMAKLQSNPEFAKLKASNGSTKAEVMECVSAVVAILIRARSTRDSAAVQELIDALRLRFPGMSEAVKLAASLLECTSSDTQ